MSYLKLSRVKRIGVFETKAIAEEGFIYGLPIVMNCTVMYEYALNPNSGQFKAPSNQLIVDPLNARAQTSLERAFPRTR